MHEKTLAHFSRGSSSNNFIASSRWAYRFIFLASFLIFVPYAHASTLSIIPDPIPDNTTPLTSVGCRLPGADAGDLVNTWESDKITQQGAVQCGQLDGGVDFPANLFWFSNVDNSYSGYLYFVEYDTSLPDANTFCNSITATVASCEGSDAYTATYQACFNGPCYPPVEGLIQTASSTLNTITGINMTSLVAFMSSLLLMVMGSGLALLESLIVWVIALVVIAGIIYFIYRAFRFFRH